MIFKKNKNKPSIIITLKKNSEGYKVIPDDKFNPFNIKKVSRVMPRTNLMQQNKITNQTGVNSNLSISASIMCPTHVTMPSSASWFNLNQIHQIQNQSFPEFFVPSKQGQGLSFSRKDANLYLYYRNTIVGLWRQNSKKYLSAGICRRNIIGDVGSIMRIHAFLQNWGIINFPSKQHKGQSLQKPNPVECYVCQNSQGPFYVAPIQDYVFQICQFCYQEDKYPLVIEKSWFRRIVSSVEQDKQMNQQELLKMLAIINSIPKDKETSKEKEISKEKQIWAAVSKQMPDFSKQQLLKNFLMIPLKHKMNFSIFEEGQDNFLKEQATDKKPATIFQDFTNPIQTSVALAYYQLKTKPEQNQGLMKYFDAAEKHSKYLAKVQSKKIESMTKMMVQLALSKLQLKIIFLKQYQKLIEQQKVAFKKASTEKIIDSLKLNTADIQ